MKRESKKIGYVSVYEFDDAAAKKMLQIREFAQAMRIGCALWYTIVAAHRSCCRRILILAQSRMIMCMHRYDSLKPMFWTKMKPSST